MGLGATSTGEQSSKNLQGQLSDATSDVSSRETELKKAEMSEKHLRKEIKDDIIANGWNDEVGSFTTAYDGTDIDASVLAIGLFGMLEHDDPRYIATVHAVESSLRSGDTVYRYKHEDGLPGEEGGFNLMTSWLIDAKVQIGDLGSARELFRAYVDLAGPTGLITEEVDPATGRALGNHPQAYSHLGLISNALHLAAHA